MSKVILLLNIMEESNEISSSKSKGLSDEVIKSPTISNNSLAPTLEYLDKNIFVKFN